MLALRWGIAWTVCVSPHWSGHCSTFLQLSTCERWFRVVWLLIRSGVYTDIIVRIYTQPWFKALYYRSCVGRAGVIWSTCRLWSLQTLQDGRSRYAKHICKYLLYLLQLACPTFQISHGDQHFWNTRSETKDVWIVCSDVRCCQC